MNKSPVLESASPSETENMWGESSPGETSEPDLGSQETQMKQNRTTRVTIPPPQGGESCTICPTDLLSVLEPRARRWAVPSVVLNFILSIIVIILIIVLSDATLRSPPSFLSPAERLQRLRKRPRRTKEDMLQEVMNQSLKENQKAREWRESESRIRQENAAERRQSMQLQQESTKELISIMARQADSIQALVAMQAEQYRTRHPLQPVSQNTCAPMSTPAHFTQHTGSYRPQQMPPTPVASPDSPGNYEPYPLHSTPIPNYRHPEVQQSLHSTPDRKPEYESRTYHIL